MKQLTFNELPQAVIQLYDKLESIERLLLQKSQPEEPDRWFDLSELCAYLPEKATKPTVYGWVHSGIIPVHKRGKKLYFLKSEIDLWLKEGRKKTYAETVAEANNYVKRKGVKYGH
ncbi:DNA-binding protein [Runella rosea]|uniref:DNA-binding protein n=1 Tax=Runella rosea TaxID=2259595 RepID=A0A344TEZ8_9BACT|nr:helix-turn-helix domain-containing protein [Runella rosea]AXE17219.1 DNA-binding protein [Runella rosea]